MNKIFWILFFLFLTFFYFEINSNEKKGKMIILYSQTTCKNCADPAYVFLTNNSISEIIKYQFEIIIYYKCNRQNDFERFKKQVKLNYPIIRDTSNILLNFRFHPRVNFIFLDSNDKQLNTDSVLRNINQYEKKKKD
jgi:thioredoxin-related protein